MPVACFIPAMDRDLYEPPDAAKIESELMMPDGLILGAPLFAAILLVLAIFQMSHLKTPAHPATAATAACCSGARQLTAM